MIRKTGCKSGKKARRETLRRNRAKDEITPLVSCFIKPVVFTAVAYRFRTFSSHVIPALDKRRAIGLLIAKSGCQTESLLKLD